MLESNVHSIIDAKMFGVTFGVNFFLPVINKGFTIVNTCRSKKDAHR